MQLVSDLDATSLRVLQQKAAAETGVSVYFSDTLLADGSIGPEMAVIPPGWFEIGSPESENGRLPEESPSKLVEVSRAYAIGRFTITAEQWEVFAWATGFRPGRELIWPKGREPIVNVRTPDILKYIAWLSRSTGFHYRLPTEAEWEYAARAGTRGAFHFGDDVSCKDVLYRSIFPMPDQKTGRSWRLFPRCSPMNWAMEVGTKPPNLWGLHDVHGNVWEVTSTPWKPDHVMTPADAHQILHPGKNVRIVTKGGSWFDPAASSRSASRWPRMTDELDVNLGFRVVRELALR